MFSNQNKLLLTGAAAAAIAKFGFHKSWTMAGLIGMAAIAVVAVVKARNSTDNPAV